MPDRMLLVRPGLIVGPEDPTDRFTYWPVRLDRGGDVLAPGDGSDPVQVIDVRDLAAWTISAAERGEVGTCNATGPAERLTMRSLLERSRAGIRSDARLVWVPAAFLAAHGAAPWTDLPAWVPAAESAMGSISNARAVARGLRFRPIEDTARDTLAWWRAEPAGRRAKLRAGIGADREREILETWKAR